jgi:hypothetical protein
MIGMSYYIIFLSQHRKTLRKLKTELSIGASYQVSVHLAKQLQRGRILEINQSEAKIKQMSGKTKFINYS